jgi:hypothetical protein
MPATGSSSMAATRTMPSHRTRALTLLVAFAAALAAANAACGGNNGSDPTDRPGAFPGLTKVDGGVQLSETAVGLLTSDLSDFERLILSDHVLTFEEYEEAFLQSERCTADLGFTVTDRRPPTYLDVGSYGARSTFSVDPDLETALSRCKTDFTTEFSLVWGQIYHPSEAQIAEARSAMASCLREAGGSLPEEPTELDISASLREPDGLARFNACRPGVEAAAGFRFR